MKKILGTNKIYISQSKIPKASRGVFAGVSIETGEMIETCPVIEVPPHELESLRESLLMSYVYFFGTNKERFLVALGFGSIYNHSYSPNAVYKINIKENTIEFISIKKIKKDQEITVNYNKGSKLSKSLWFEE